MGRRKSKRKPPAKRKAIEPLDQQFNCPFCNHEKSCEVKMYVLKISKGTNSCMFKTNMVFNFVYIYRDRARNTARIQCRVCLEDFQTTTNVLSEPIDVYNDWVDACESAN